jgi:hypothetical protein
MTICVNVILGSRICFVQEGCQYLWGFQYRESKGVTRSKNDEWRWSFSLNTPFGSIWSAADEIEIDSASPSFEFQSGHAIGSFKKVDSIPPRWA